MVLRFLIAVALLGTVNLFLLLLLIYIEIYNGMALETAIRAICGSG